MTMIDFAVSLIDLGNMAELKSSLEAFKPIFEGSGYSFDD